MSFADPQSITITGVTTSLPRTGSGVGSGTFQSNDGTIKMSVNHSSKKRNRHQVRVDLTKIAADPYIAAQNVSVSTSVYLVVDEPVQGFTRAELLALVTGFITQLQASSNADLTKFLGGES